MENTIKVPVAEHRASQLGLSILRTLLYFDIFHYPLTMEEILHFSGQLITSNEQLKHELNQLEKSELIFHFHPFYGIHNDESNCIRRVKGNKEAEKYIPLARKRALLISRFPFGNLSGTSKIPRVGFTAENGIL